MPYQFQLYFFMLKAAEYQLLFVSQSRGCAYSDHQGAQFTIYIYKRDSFCFFD